MNLAGHHTVHTIGTGYTPAREQSDVGGNKAGKGKGILKAILFGHLANIIAVIQYGYACIP